ncbi:MAG: hypothetical protein GY798_35110 [Hyphomicrobiales bacterium]|nr:hypothetical protein [Hyphomicrobiales bacterium]
MAREQWVRVGGQANNKLSEAEKKAITASCERLVEDVLKPRFLPEIRPTEFNYCVDIFGKWHGNKYRFMQRFRNDRPDRFGEQEFTAPFARIEYVGRDRFDLAYFRHNEQWQPVDRGVTLEEALELLEANNIYHPVV